MPSAIDDLFCIEAECCADAGLRRPMAPKIGGWGGKAGLCTRLRHTPPTLSRQQPPRQPHRGMADQRLPPSGLCRSGIADRKTAGHGTTPRRHVTGPPSNVIVENPRPCAAVTVDETAAPDAVRRWRVWPIARARAVIVPGQRQARLSIVVLVARVSRTTRVHVDQKNPRHLRVGGPRPPVRPRLFRGRGTNFSAKGFSATEFWVVNSGDVMGFVLSGGSDAGRFLVLARLLESRSLSFSNRPRRVLHGLDVLETACGPAFSLVCGWRRAQASAMQSCMVYSRCEERSGKLHHLSRFAGEAERLETASAAFRIGRKS